MVVRGLRISYTMAMNGFEHFPTPADSIARQAEMARATYGTINLSAGEVAPAPIDTKKAREKRLKKLIKAGVDLNIIPTLY